MGEKSRLIGGWRRSMLTLYDFGNSVCCQKVRITLREKGQEWEAIRVDLFKAEQYDPKYLKLNPKGLVPTFVHNGTPIAESTLICEYIDEAFPDPPLKPNDPAARAYAAVEQVR
jgi:glutathione S-transferase